MTTSKRNDPKMRQLQNATTCKLPKKKGQERASSDFYDFFPERQLNLLVTFFTLTFFTIYVSDLQDKLYSDWEKKI